MKKFLLILGMITCLVGLTACSSTAENTDPAATEQAQAIVQSFVESMTQIVATGTQSQYAEDPVISAAIASYEEALSELGDYKSIDGCSYKEDGTDMVITGNLTYSLRKATVELIYEDGYLTSATTNVIYSMSEQMTKAGLNTLMGMGTVFAVLILISAIISCFGLISKAQGGSAKKEEKAAPAASGVDNAVAQIVENEAVQSDDLELVAVIAAAIAASEGATSTDGYVVRSIRRIR